MKPGVPFLRSTCRLLTLLLVIVGVGKAVLPVHGASLNPSALKNFDFSGLLQPSGNLSSGTKKDEEGFTTEIRKEKLFNMCSLKHVQILRVGKGVNAKGRKKSGKLNNLVFQNAAEGTLRIFGKHTGFYICFNRRGKLIVRRKGNKRLCQFREVEDNNGFVKYKAADEKLDWFMGFKKNGKPLKGHSTKNPECFKFLKTERQHLCKKKGPHGIAHCSFIKNSFIPNPMTPALRHRRRKDRKKERVGG